MEADDEMEQEYRNNGYYNDYVLTIGHVEPIAHSIQNAQRPRCAEYVHHYEEPPDHTPNMVILRKVFNHPDLLLFELPTLSVVLKSVFGHGRFEA